MKSCSVACIDILVLHDHILNCTIHSIVAIVAVVGITISNREGIEGGYDPIVDRQH